MPFSTPLFLFLFLPILLLLFFFVKPRAQNAFLLGCSLFFYIWAEGRTSWILLAGIAATWGLGRAMAKTGRPGRRSLYLAAGIIFNILLLCLFKYAAFFTASLNTVMGWFGARPLAVAHLPLPLGISFSTFLSISFLVDCHRNLAAGRPKLIDTSLYISSFMTILAGPITPYRELAPQIRSFEERQHLFHEGIQRFIVGLGKKILIADILAKIANPIFAIPTSDLTCSLAWLGIIAYTLQIYFDFSGYTDMAIGLGRIFGLRFMENFNFPYAAVSIQDFWSRWHMSLTRWLRDYLFLPIAYRILRTTRREKWLGVKIESWSYGIGMLLTMLLCGFWHGAAWTFVAWGFYHGLFLLGERFLWGRRLKKAWRPLRHTYALLVVAAGWVLFRSATFPMAASFLKAMAGFNRGQPATFYTSLYLNREALIVLLAAILGAMPLAAKLKKAFAREIDPPGSSPRSVMARGRSFVLQLLLVSIFVISLLYLAHETHQPFIYFRF